VRLIINDIQAKRLLRMVKREDILFLRAHGGIIVTCYGFIYFKETVRS
jgi:hypothetical protein